MRTVFLLSILAVSYGTVFRPLSELTTLATPVSITSLWPDTSFPVLTGTAGPATFDGTFNFDIQINFTYSGNVTIGFAVLTWSQQDDTQSQQISFTCHADIMKCIGKTTTTAIFVYTGTYQVSLQVFSNTDLIRTYSSADLQNLPFADGGLNNWHQTVVNPAYAFTPALSSVILPSPQGLVCQNVGLGCDYYYNATITPVQDTDVTLYFTSSIPASGVMWSLHASCAGGVCNQNSPNRDMTWSIGDVVNGKFQFGYGGPPGPFPAQLADGAVLTSVSADLDNIDSTFGVRLPYTVTVQANQGSLDQDAPTCSVASFPVTSVSPVSTSVNVPLTVTCTDPGVGVVTKGAIVRLTTATQTRDAVAVFPDSQASTNIGAPPYTDGTIEVIGVFAVDFAGNAVLYGSCGGGTTIGTICGSSGGAVLGLNVFGVMLLVGIALLL